MNPVIGLMIVDYFTVLDINCIEFPHDQVSLSYT